jgi:hypothetical protein
VYITSTASAAVLVVTFLGLYAAPSWIELRNERFFEATITTAGRTAHVWNPVDP